MATFFEVYEDLSNLAEGKQTSRPRIDPSIVQAKVDAQKKNKELFDTTAIPGVSVAANQYWTFLVSKEALKGFADMPHEDAKKAAARLNAILPSVAINGSCAAESESLLNKAPDYPIFALRLCKGETSLPIRLLVFLLRTNEGKRYMVIGSAFIHRKKVWLDSEKNSADRAFERFLR